MFKKKIEEYLNKYGFDTFNPKAVLFDMDGVLYNSMPNHAVSWNLSMAKFGLKMAQSDAYKYEGMRGVETIKKIAKEQWGREISDEESKKMYEVKCEFFRKCKKAEKMEGVEELMNKIKDDGLDITVVTGSGQHSLLDKLDNAFPGLVDKEKVVTSFDVKHGKPNPEPYLCGLNKMNVLPNEAIVVENAPLGVRSAVAARIFTIAVNTGPLPNEMLENEGANLVFNKMTDLRDAWESLRNDFN